MANTVTQTANVVTISSIDSDWSWSDTFSGRDSILVDSIQFTPAATDDACIIKNVSDAGASIFNAKSADAYDQKVKYFHGVPLSPVLDFSAGTFTAGSSVTIILSTIDGE